MEKWGGRIMEAIIIYAGVATICGCTSKSLDKKGKNTIARILDITFFISSGYYLIKYLDEIFRVIAWNFL